MVKLDEQGRLAFDTRLYGFGKVLVYIYNNFFLIRAGIFAFACLALSIGIRFPMFIFIFLELLIMYCQFRAPLIDQAKRADFAKWVDNSITASGGETCHSFNKMMEACWEVLMPDSYSDWYSNLGTATLKASLPGFVKDIEVTKFSFGHSPPRFIQMNTEDTPPFPGSVAFQASMILANGWGFEMTFTMFGIPFTVVCKDVTMYATMRVIVETPEETKFMHLNPITAVTYTTADQPFKMLSGKILVNGFDIMKIPMLHEACLRYMDSYAYSCFGGGQCFSNDWVQCRWKWRRFDRIHSDLSQDLFSGIATKSRADKDPGRFSLPAATLQRWNETFGIWYDRIYSTKLEPGEELIWMQPWPEAEIEPVFEFTEDSRKSKADVETQTTKIDE